MGHREGDGHAWTTQPAGTKAVGCQPSLPWLSPASRGRRWLRRVSRGKMSPAHRWAEEGGGGETRGNCADTAESAFEIFISSAPRRRGRARDLNAEEPGPPALPCPRHCASAASDPHSWGLTGGRGGTGRRLRSMAARLKVSAGGGPGQRHTGGRGWKLRHREDRDPLNLPSQGQPPPRPRAVLSATQMGSLPVTHVGAPEKSPVDTGDPGGFQSGPSDGARTSGNLTAKPLPGASCRPTPGWS